MKATAGLRRTMRGGRGVLASAAVCGLVGVAGCGSSGGRSDGTVTTTVPGAKSIYLVQGSSGVSSSLLTFAVGSDGNAVPTATLAMPSGFTNQSVATDSSGQIYVGGIVNFIYQILVYPAGASGSATPRRTIVMGDGTVTGGADSLAIDAAGNIYAASSFSDAVAVYAATANGASVPIQVIQSSVYGIPGSVAVDKAGNIYVSGAPLDAHATGAVYVFAPGSTGNATPIRTITMPGFSYGIALDSKGDLYVLETNGVPNGANSVSSSSAQIVEFSPTATGAATPMRSINIPSEGMPIVLGQGLCVDKADNIFAALWMFSNDTDTATLTTSVMEFGVSASENAIPITNFTSTSWNYADPATLAVE